MARLTVGPEAMPNVAGRVLLGLLPLWILLIRMIAFPESMDPVTAKPPEMVGLPAGVLLVTTALALMAIGIEVLRRTSSNRAALLAFVGLTLPSAALVILAPALVLIVENMAV